MEVVESKKKYELLAEEIMKLNYGAVITHDEISAVIQEEYGSQEYRNEVGYAIKYLWKKYNRRMKSVRKVGYRVLTPDEYNNETLNLYFKGMKSIKQGTDVLDYAPTKDMTNEGREAYRRIKDKAVSFNASVQGSFVELKLLGKKDHPFSHMEES